MGATTVIITYDAKCKHCKYFLRTQPKKRAVFRCAVDNKYLTMQSKACLGFEL